MNDDIQSGVDELGVLLLGHERKAFWYGSNLDITEARKIAPGNNATTVQVVGGVISAVIWCLNNPSRGYCETEDLPYKEILSVAEPYIAPVLQAFSDWQPSEGGAQSDTSNDVWQYTNFIVGR